MTSDPSTSPGTMTRDPPGSPDGVPGSNRPPASPPMLGSPTPHGSPGRSSSPRRAKHKPHPMSPKWIMDQRKRRRKHEKRRDPKDSPGADNEGAKTPKDIRARDGLPSPYATPDLSRSTHEARLRCNLVSIVAIVLAVGFLFAFFSIVILIILSAQTSGICSKPACIRHAKELKSAMNTSVKPCANFYSFVCGSWKPVGKERSMIQRIYAKSQEIAIRELEGEPTDAPVKLAPLYFQSCMANRSDAVVKSEIEKFKSLKGGLGLKWPEEWPETGQFVKDPLLILLNMTVNWNINMFIKVRAMPGYMGRQKSLYFSRGDWYKWAAMTDEQFAALVKENCDYLGVPPPDGLLELKKHLQVVTTGAPVYRSDTREEEKRTLKDIDQFTVSWRGRWWQYLNDIYKPEFTWSLDDIVMIQHPGILGYLDGLLEKISGASFRRVLSWLFIRMYLWIVMGKPEIRIKGDASALYTFKKRTCLSHVESTFGLAVSARHIYERFSKEIRENVSKVFIKLKEHMKLSFKHSSWIDDVVKKSAYDKLDGIWESVLPDNRFFSNYSLASLYKNFPEIGNSFMDNVVNVAKAFRKTLARDDYVRIFSKRLGGGSVTSIYSYYYNSVSMDVGALEPPMLYADATFAILYGSLGASLAASMAQSFDERGILFNEKGEEEPWWIAGHERYEERVKCYLEDAANRPSHPDSSQSHAFVPFSSRIPALHAAYLAYRKAVKDEGIVEVLSLQGLEDYTDDQVFFMTYCLMTCATNSNGEECNVPLRHSRKFASTFRCDVDDNMNPRKKCLFFD